jgi:phosphoglycolate phosphatase
LSTRASRSLVASTPRSRRRAWPRSPNRSFTSISVLHYTRRSPHSSKGTSQVQSCVDAYRARYTALAAQETTVFALGEALLERLAERFPLIVATSKPHGLAEPVLRALRLRRFVVAVVGPNLNSDNEPKAVTVERALGVLPIGARPVMVGDRRYDIAAAREHGLASIGVFWGIGSEGELRDAGADELADTPEALAAALDPGLTC